MTTQPNLTEPLVIERTFNAPVAQVWVALTDVDAMRHWYFDLKEFQPEVGFEFQFVVEHQGILYDHRCQVTEVIPQKKLAYTWRYHGLEGDSLVTIELFPEDDRTRVKLTHEGLETFPKLPSHARENFMAGWTHIIGSALKEFVEMPDDKLVVRREFNVPAGVVWKAWTERAHVRQWLAGADGMKIESVIMDLRVGGKFRIQQKSAECEYFTAAGTYLEVIPGERLVHTWDWEKDGADTEFGELEGNETQVTVEFLPQGEKCEVVLTHEKFKTAKSRDGHRQGWTKWLEKVAESIEA